MSGYANPRKLKQRNRTERDITSPITGDKYRIRKIDVVDFLVNGPLPLVEWVKGKAEDEIEQGIRQAATEAMEQNPGLIPKLNDTLLVQGVVAPRVVLGPECSDDECVPEDLGDDKQWLICEIMHFNGLLSDEQASSFRGKVLALAGRTGDQVRVPTE
jgi:hypothetical protein